MGEAVPRFLRRLCKATILALIVAVLAFVVHIVYGCIMDSPVLNLHEVIIEGCQKTSERDILSMTQLDRRPSILSIKLAALRKKVEANPWIERAEVRRTFPNRISIKVVERRPAAIILLDRLYYIDPGGVIFARVSKDGQIDHPILTGLRPDDFKAHPHEARELVSRALRLIELMEGGDALSQKDISEIHMDRAFGISIYTNDGAIEVKLGLVDYEAKWKRLVRVWRHLRQQPLKPAYIDCNYKKRVVVRMSDTSTFYAKGLLKDS